MASLTKTASKRVGKGIVKESLNRGGGVCIYWNGPFIIYIIEIYPPVRLPNYIINNKV